MVRVGEAQFRVVKKEVVLRDRVVGFKHWAEPVGLLEGIQESDPS
jgi:hypothetical protein